MGKLKPGVRDGTGPWKGSYQYEMKGIGRRQEAGEPCPFDETEKKKKTAVKKLMKN